MGEEGESQREDKYKNYIRLMSLGGEGGEGRRGPYSKSKTVIVLDPRFIFAPSSTLSTARKFAEVSRSAKNV